MHMGSVPGQYDEDIVDWMARNKLNHKMTHHHVIGHTYGELTSRAIRPETNGHAFWWLVPAAECYGGHPGCYPLIDGVRKRPKGPGVDCQLCLSNPTVLSVAVKRLRRLAARYPQVRILGVSPNDNNTGIGWCECGPCRAVGASITDRLVVFVNAVARQLPATHPGLLAYSDCTRPPAIRPHRNVVVEYVRNGRCYKHTLFDEACAINVKRREEILGWLRMVEGHRLLWGDYTDPWDDLPHPTARTVANDLEQIAERGMAGFTIAVTPASWGMLKLNHYVLAKMSWDTSLRYEDVLEDFCQSYYGPAAEPMMRWHAAQEEAAARSVGCFRRGNIANVEKVLTKVLLQELDACLASAERLIPGRKPANDRLWLRSLDASAANLVPNAGFEAGQEGWRMPVQRGRYEHSIDTHQFHSGTRSAKITCMAPGRAMWHRDLPVERGSRYRFSAWVRAAGKKPGTTILWVHQGPTHRTGQLLYLDDEVDGEWQKYVVPQFTAIQDHVALFLMSDGKGSIWFDDIELVKLNGGPAAPVSTAGPTEPDKTGYRNRLLQERTALRRWAVHLVRVRAARRAAAAREVRVIPVTKGWTADGPIAEWEVGPGVTNFVEKIGQVLAKPQTECWLAYDPERLYVTFKCHEPQLDRLVTCSIEHDGPVWNCDDVEVFIDTNGDGNTYYLFGMDSLGNRFDVNCSKTPYKQALEWSIPWEARTARGDACWYAQFTIPLGEIGLNPRRGGTFGISLNRSRYATGSNVPSAWPNGLFHQPKRFGTAVFE